MKKLWILLAAAGFLYACDNNVGDRTYNLKTVDDSIEGESDRGAADTVPTTNNNIYNPDSAAGRGTTYDTSGSRSVPGQPPRQ